MDYEIKFNYGNYTPEMLIYNYKKQFYEYITRLDGKYEHRKELFKQGLL